MKFDINDAKKIKLVIWDLDETFWQGTLSDYDSVVEPKKECIELVRVLTNRGIVNAVCSKNDREEAEAKLREFQILDFFVFNSIDWTSKGQRIRKMISDMALRPENVLFLDDNLSNLAEVEYALPEMMVAEPQVVKALLDIADSLGKDDSLLSRLNQYRLLEKKREESKGFKSNIDFLRHSHIKIEFNYLDEESIERIEELIQRSNQLNFTKKRINIEQLRTLMGNSEYELGYVKVDDNYGKYGIVGFYGLYKSTNSLEHFLFSCRTMGMGIEQYVYAALGYPELEIVEPVSGGVSKNEGMPDYIERVDSLTINASAKDSKLSKVLLKGPCDLEVMASYIEGGGSSITKEFNFIDVNGNQADYYNHTINILDTRFSEVSYLEELCQKYHFLSLEGFQTSLFSGQYDVVCFSPLMDATLGVYQRTDGFNLAYGLYNKPLDTKEFYNDYINKKVMTASSKISRTDLELFSKEFSFVHYDAENTVQNLRIIAKEIHKTNPKTKIIFFTLAELPFDDSSGRFADSFRDKHLLHKSINSQMKKAFEEISYVSFLEVNNYIHSQSDYFDNINHYSKLVYFKMAKEITKEIEKITGNRLSTSTKLRAIVDTIKRTVYKKYKKLLKK